MKDRGKTAILSCYTTWSFFYLNRSSAAIINSVSIYFVFIVIRSSSAAIDRRVFPTTTKYNRRRLVPLSVCLPGDLPIRMRLLLCSSVFTSDLVVLLFVRAIAFTLSLSPFPRFMSIDCSVSTVGAHINRQSNALLHGAILWTFNRSCDDQEEKRNDP